MKKYLILSMALLCICGKALGQAELITFPVEGSVFQANSSGNHSFTFGGQLKTTSPIYYKIEKRDGNTTWTTVINETQITSHTTLIGEPRYLFQVSNLNLNGKGWYRVSIYRKTSISFLSSLFKLIGSRVEFGVGDVYFVAGQSNASGYGGSGYKLQDLNGGLDNTQSSILSNTSSNPMARVFDNKVDEQMTTPALNEKQKQLNFSIPYKVRFKEFKNGEIQNPSKVLDPLDPSKLDDRIGMYPNGYNSWYWAPLAHKLANPSNSHKYSGTPTLWFNCSSPSTSLQDNGLDIINIWNVNPNIATNRTAFLNRPENQTLRGKFKQTLQTYAGPFGAKAVLWHQGETDHEGFLDNNSYTSRTNYKTQLENLIDFSRLSATGNSSDASMSWYVSKATFIPKSVSVSNPTNSQSNTLQGIVSNTYLGASTDKAWTSDILRNNQSASRSNVFEGPNTDLIDNSNSSKLRSGKYLIHFSGSSLQTVADDWYSKLTTSGNYTTSSLVPTTPIKISMAEKISASSYKIVIDNTIGGEEFIWCVDAYGLNTWYSKTTVPECTFNGVASDMFLHCLVRKNGRYHAVIPFMVPGGLIEQKKLTLDDSNLPVPASGGVVSTGVTAVDLAWDISGSYPSWLTISYNENENRIEFTASPNTTSNARTAVITLQESGGSITTSVSISQTSSTAVTTSLTSLNPSSNSSYYNLNHSVDNNTMQVSGVQYYQGFGIHANNSLFFNLGGQYSTFTGKVGRDDEGDNSYNSGNVQFTIKGDGAVLWTSGIHGNTTNAESFTVNVSGKTTIELYTDISNDNNYFDHGDWMDLFVSTGPGSTCTNSNPTNVYANPTSVSSSGGNSTLYATCSAGTTANWSTGQTGASVVVYVSSTTNYTVTCVGNSCNPSNPASVTVTVPPSVGCSNITDNLNMASWNVTNHPLIARQFHNQMWLTQRIGTNPESFLVRGSSMLTRNDISNTSYSSQVSCFAWAYSDYGGLATPNSSEFPTPAGFTLAYECAQAPCNATNGTPYYTATSTPPTGNCSSSVYLNNSWTYASAGYNPPPKIGTNIGGYDMAMGGVNYSTTYPNTGIGTHTTSEIIYDLGASHPYSHFLTTVGKDNAALCGSQYGQEKLLFKVINNANGAVLATSPYLGNPNSGLSQSADMNVSISGVRYLKLVVEDGGDGGSCDWANWARARLACSSNGRVAATDSTEEIEFMSIVPNPNSGQFDLRLYLEEDSRLEISLMNSNGQIYESMSSHGKKGMNNIPYRTKKVASGSYILRVVSNTKIESRILVIE